MNVKKIGFGIVTLFTVASMLTACSGTAAAPSSTASGTAPASSAADTSSAKEVSYPVTVTHAFGQTVIQSEPKNIVAISWGNLDVPLALGVVPTGVSKANFGAVDKNGLLPWSEAAYEKLGEKKPVVFDDTDGLDYEAISDAKPDVILAAYSGITKEEYDLLSKIAPVIAYPKYAWQTYWREQTIMDAKGMGREAKGEALVAETDKLINTKVSQYANMKGKTGAFLYFNASDLGKFYVYLPTDPRAAYLTDLGLKFPDSVKKLAQGADSFSVTLSAENIDVLKDVDIIITYGDEAVLKTLKADPLVGKIPAVANGSVVMVNNTSTLAASCTPSVLSIPATIDEYLKLIDDAAKKVK